MKDELEGRWRDLGEFIREQRRVGHLSLRKLSDMAGISNPYLSQIERGIYKPSAEVLKAIADALQIRSETLFTRAGLIDEATESGPTDVEKAIRSDSRLSAEHKRALIDVYRSFLSQTDSPPTARSPKQSKKKTKQTT